MARDSGKGFRKLIVWQRAHQLVLAVYDVSEKLPDREKYGLISQMRRAAVSVPANIAEGYAHQSNGQFSRYLHIAQGSLAEVEYYLILAEDLNYLPSESYTELENLRGEVGYLLHRLILSTKNPK